MQVKVLGCSGGIGAARRTTSLLVDDDVLLDAGTGVMDLDLEQLRRIDHVYLSHCHLDHIAALPLMVDSVGALRERPLVVHARESCLITLDEHIFNWCIWPNFYVIPTPQQPFLVSEHIAVGETVELSRGRRLSFLPVEHTVPALAFHLSGGEGSLVFSGDTTRCDAFWDAVNAIPDLKYLIIETAFTEQEKAIALASKHLCPSMLAGELEKYKGGAQIYITHLKPTQEAAIMEQVRQVAGKWSPRRLEMGMTFQI